jgi:radical SAM protein with 4Fe4S-binding SPASM domain
VIDGSWVSNTQGLADISMDIMRRQGVTLELVASPLQRAFGDAKRETLPKNCRECEVRFACNGECPTNRFTVTPDGVAGLNCGGFADEVMQTFATAPRNEPCECECRHPGRCRSRPMEGGGHGEEEEQEEGQEEGQEEEVGARHGGPLTVLRASDVGGPPR